LGSEQSGLTPALAASCHTLAKIPLAGKADSLNLAIATGVMLFEIMRPRLAL
jgi:TrmH family RNA methyltransferase